MSGEKIDLRERLWICFGGLVFGGILGVVGEVLLFSRLSSVGATTGSTIAVGLAILFPRQVRSVLEILAVVMPPPP